MTLVGFLGPRPSSGVAAPNPEPTTAVPTRLPVGLGARSRQRATTAASGYTTLNALGQLITAGTNGGFCVVEVHADQVFDYDATNGITWKTGGIASIVSDLDWCQTNGLRSLLRFFWGYYAPATLKTAAGGALTWYTNDGTTGTGAVAPSDRAWRQMPNGMLRWTAPVAQTAYAQAQTRMAAETSISGHVALAGVTYSATMTQYAEPEIKQYNLAENRTSALSMHPAATIAEQAAALNAADAAAMLAGFAAHRDIWSPLGVATFCSYNAAMTIGPGGGLEMSQATTNNAMTRQVEILGRCAVLENNSWSNPEHAAWARTYAGQDAYRARTTPHPVALHRQTKTVTKLEAMWDAQAAGAKVTTVRSTLDLALTRLVNAVELPSGAENASWTGTPGSSTLRWTALTVDEAAAYNNSFHTSAALYA